MNRVDDDEDGLERALGSPAPAAPAAFTDRVMARIAAERRSHVPAHADLWQRAAVMPWWIHAAADPAVALALILSAIVMWRATALIALFDGLAAWVASALSTLGTPFGSGAAGPALPHDRVALGLALAALPAVAWGSWRLFLWVERTSQPFARSQPSR